MTDQHLTVVRVAGVVSLVCGVLSAVLLIRVGQTFLFGCLVAIVGIAYGLIGVLAERQRRFRLLSAVGLSISLLAGVGLVLAWLYVLPSNDM